MDAGEGSGGCSEVQVMEMEEKKHMNSFSQYISESLDKPYRYKLGKSSKVLGLPGQEDYKFQTKNGQWGNVTIDYYDFDENGEYPTIGVMFSINLSYDVTGGGDEFRIFATVIDVLRTVIQKSKPKDILFSANKDPENVSDKGRGNLYTRIVKRFASKAGYDAIIQENPVSFKFVLRLKEWYK